MTPEQKERNYRLAERLLAEQNFRAAVVFGLLAAITMAALWGLIAALTGYIIGSMAMADGASVGYTVQRMGKGIHYRYALLASVLATFGCIVGSILAIVLDESVEHQMPVTELLSSVPMHSIARTILSDFGLVGMAFWIVAISGAAYIARRRLTRAEGLAIFTLQHRFEVESETE